MINLDNTQSKWADLDGPRFMVLGNVQFHP